jgi:hypothetical protein
MLKRVPRWVTVPVIAICLLLVVVVPVLAYLYYAPVTITESAGTSYDVLALSFNMSILYLITNGFITTSTALDTRITTLDGTAQPHMVANDKVLTVVTNLAGNTSVNRYFITGEATLSSFPIITGYNGYVTVNDTADLEPGDVYAFGVVAYFDTSAGADKYVIWKDGAIDFYVTADEELSFNVTGGNSLVATGVASGVHTIMVYSDSVDMWMDIDDVEQDRVAASVVTDTANVWKLFENNVCPYVYYYGEWVVP